MEHVLDYRLSGMKASSCATEKLCESCEDCEAHFAKLQDLEMLVLFASRERAEDEYGRLLSQAGFRLQRVVPTVQPVSVVEAVPI
jgi:hypothetical protein